MRKYINLLIITLISILCFACASTFLVPYNIVVSNRSSDTIQNAIVSFGEIQFRNGFIGAGSSSVISEPSAPITDTAVVTWETSDGERHSEEVSIRGKLPSRRSEDAYEFLFGIDENKLSLTVKSKSRF